MSAGLLLDRHSQTLSRYRTTRGLLPAGFLPWAGSPLLRRPGRSALRQAIHIGAVLSADARSTCTTQHQDSRSHEIPTPSLQVAGLQAHATTPGGGQIDCLHTSQLIYELTRRNTYKVHDNTQSHLHPISSIHLCPSHTNKSPRHAQKRTVHILSPTVFPIHIYINIPFGS